MRLHKDLTGTDLHVNKLHADTHAPGGTDPLPDIVTEISIVGDGIVDDTIAIKAILENATPRHKYQFPPNKTVKVTSVITIDQPIELDLNGSTIMSYVGALENTILAAGSIDTPHNVTADITGLTIQLSVPDAQNYDVGDYVKISTVENYFIIADRDYKKGEIVRLSAVDKATGILTVIGNGTRLQYLATQTTQISKLNLLEYFKITNGFIYGTGTDDRQVGVVGQYVKKLDVSNVRIGFLEVGVAVAACYSGDISGCYFKDINRYGTGYAVEMGNASRNINVHHNTFENGRHAITTAGYDGVCIGLDFNHNLVIDNILGAGINTHGNARDVNISDNIIINCAIGISVYSPCSHIHDNIIINATTIGIYAVEAGGVNIRVKNNYIEHVGTTDGISIYATATTHEPNLFVTVEGNEVIEAGGIGILVTCSSLMTIVNNNRLYYSGYSGITVTAGEQIQCNDNLIFASARATYYAIDITASSVLSTLTAVYGSTCSIKNNQIPRFGKGLNVSTIGTLSLGGNLVLCNEDYKYTLTDVTTLIGEEVLRDTNGVLYKLSVATDGTLTAAAL